MPSKLARRGYLSLLAGGGSRLLRLLRFLLGFLELVLELRDALLEPRLHRLQRRDLLAQNLLLAEAEQTQQISRKCQHSDCTTENAKVYFTGWLSASATKIESVETMEI